MVGHIASGNDSWAEQNSLVEETTELRLLKITGGLISVSFQCGVEIINTVGVPQYVKILCTESHEKYSLEKTGRDYGFQPELFKREIEHSVDNKSVFADLKHTWEQNLKLDVL